MSQITHIPIIFDKSHLLTIGERLYATRLDLVRELVSNAYDADATMVRIEIAPDTITVEDNGGGMDEAQLRQYFTIGSQDKRRRPVSPGLGRRRIGEFGIGKFSVLTIAGRFQVETWRGKPAFSARLLFDAQAWQRDAGNWQVPCEIVPYGDRSGSGTRIILDRIKKSLDATLVIRHVRERLPIGREDFKIFVNGVAVTATAIPGKRFPVFFTTQFGPVEGEIILANVPQTQRNIQEAGVTIRVKNISVTKSLFGFETSHGVGVNRLRGSVNADFLPITSSRDRVIQDSPEYQAFSERMRSAVAGVLREARQMAFQRENLLASQMLRSALDKIGRALKKNPDAFESKTADPPLGEPAVGGEEGYVISQAQFVDTDDRRPAGAEYQAGPLSDHRPKKRRHMTLADRAVIRRMQFRNVGIVCRMERFGPKYPPSFLEQGVIYLNIDHPLYRKQADQQALLTMFIATLISKELALQKHPQSSAAAYDLQTQLLTDAFKDAREIYKDPQ